MLVVNLEIGETLEVGNAKIIIIQKSGAKKFKVGVVAPREINVGRASCIKKERKYASVKEGDNLNTNDINCATS